MKGVVSVFEGVWEQVGDAVAMWMMQDKVGDQEKGYDVGRDRAVVQKVSGTQKIRNEKQALDNSTILEAIK